jgi:glycosyltransferase involved in cell wall biosynthesis
MHGIGARCHWLGQVEGAAKVRELASADWLVLPSAAENFGIAVAEALAAGTPVIVSPQVAVADLVATAGAGLVCPSEPAALAETLATALAGASPTLRAAARNLAQQHLAWPAIAAELNSAYAAICRNASLR